MIGEILNEERIRNPLMGKTKEEVIEELVDLICGEDPSAQPFCEKKEMIRKCQEREGRMSTGIGKGVALPRIRGNDVNGIFASLGIKPEGIEFQALDGNPVRIFCLIAAGEKEENAYLEALSRLSRILNQEDFQERLLKGKTSREIFDLLRKEEKKLWR